jgi:hypothetical protein
MVVLVSAAMRAIAAVNTHTAGRPAPIAAKDARRDLVAVTDLPPRLPRAIVPALAPLV